MKNVRFMKPGILQFFSLFLPEIIVSYFIRIGSILIICCYITEFDDDLWKEDLPDIDNESNTAFVFNRNISLSLNEQRNRLPIAKYKLKILYVLENYQVLVLVGDTGCGKSTQIPQVCNMSVG